MPFRQSDLTWPMIMAILEAKPGADGMLALTSGYPATLAALRRRSIIYSSRYTLTPSGIALRNAIRKAAQPGDFERAMISGGWFEREKSGTGNAVRR